MLRVTEFPAPSQLTLINGIKVIAPFDRAQDRFFKKAITLSSPKKFPEKTLSLLQKNDDQHRRYKLLLLRNHSPLSDW